MHIIIANHAFYNLIQALKSIHLNPCDKSYLEQHTLFSHGHVCKCMGYGQERMIPVHHKSEKSSHVYVKW